MPQESPCKGVLITLKSTTPGDLEVPWDPGGEENIKYKVNTLPQEQCSRHQCAMWCHGACMVGHVVQLHSKVVRRLGKVRQLKGHN